MSGPHHIDHMEMAFRQAEAAYARGEVPIGAVLVDPGTGEVLAADHNRVEELHDPTAHAEMLVIRAVATGRKEKRLPFADLYVTLEPCPMCATAMVHARVTRLVFGAWDPRQGAAGSAFDLTHARALNHNLDAFGGVLADECSAQLKGFFARRRP